MNKEKLMENCQTDPNGVSAEKGFTVSFTKADEKANISSGIASMTKRAIGHTDIDVENIQVFHEDSEEYELMELEDYEGGRIVGFKGKAPIELLKVRANPRSTRSFSQIISPQTDVSFDGE